MEGGGDVRGPLTSPSPHPHPVLCCQVTEIDTAVHSRRISVDTQSPAFSILPLFPLNNPWKLAEHTRDLSYMCRMLYIRWGDRSVLLPFFFCGLIFCGIAPPCGLTKSYTVTAISLLLDLYGIHVSVNFIIFFILVSCLDIMTSRNGSECLYDG